MSIIDPVLAPLLKLDPFVAIIVLALLISTVITLSYKYFTDQAKMKRLKKQLKKYQAEMKELRKEPEKMMKVQQKAMQTNMEYMKMSMRPTFITFLPIILVPPNLPAMRPGNFRVLRGSIPLSFRLMVRPSQSK